ncbi:hypothetical protein PSYPI_08415, partial [Pseudomonas syringae pv. pisi str. 1704B]
PQRSVTLGQRVFTGVVVGFTFRIVQDLLGPSSLLFGFPPLLAVLRLPQPVRWPGYFCYAVPGNAPAGLKKPTPGSAFSWALS